MSTKMTRRSFLVSAAGTAAAMLLSPGINAATRTRAIGANSRLRIGMIGLGGRGYGAHMPGIRPYAKSMNLEVVAVCDPWRVARERAAARAKEWFGSEVKQFVSYRDLLAMPDLDAVMIASPDHLHTRHLEAAAKAGKHIYVEKPLGNEMDKLIRAVDAAKAAGTVIQVGTQLRSMPSVVGAREVYRSGILGTVSRIEQCRNAEKPYWYGQLDGSVKEADVDWKEFLDDRPMRPFDSRVYSAWYGYYEFSQGPVPQWGVHFIDTINFITGATFPDTCVCNGGIYTFKDENKFTAPDHVQALWTYPEGYMVSYSTNFGNGFGKSEKIFGDKGVMKMENLSDIVYTAEGGVHRDGKIRGVNSVKPVERPDHFLDWLQCIRNGGTPWAPIDAGFQHAVASIMAVESYNTGRRTRYDREKRAIIKD